MAQTRLHEQGFTNLHRKLIFGVVSAGLAAYLFFAPDLWKLSRPAILCVQVTGTLLLVIGIIGRIFATLSIGGRKDRSIVKTEMYSICRNPLYFASLVMVVGFGLLSGRLDFTFLATGSYLALFYPMMFNEAAFLRKKFPDFAEYEKRVPLFLPNPALWKQRERFEINFPLVKRTMLDASLVLLAIPGMILVRAFW